MKTATVRDLRNQFARVSKWIEEGESVEITKSGQPFARLTPAAPTDPKKVEMPDFVARMRRCFPSAASKVSPTTIRETDDAICRFRLRRILYKSELTSESAGRVMAEGCMPVLLSQLNCLEVQNALHLAVFRGKITHAERLAKRGFFQADVQAGVFSIVPVPSVELHDLAGELADRYSAVEGTRSLDLLHVAAGLLLKVGELLSFETRQRNVATKEGLRVQP